jgi:hypothetical protein
MDELFDSYEALCLQHRNAVVRLMRLEAIPPFVREQHIKALIREMERECQEFDAVMVFLTRTHAQPES